MSVSVLTPRAMSSRTRGSGPFWGGRTNFSPGTSKKTAFRSWPKRHSCHQHHLLFLFLRDLPQTHQTVELSQRCVLKVEWMELALATGYGYTRSPIRGCFARGSVVSLCCVGFHTGSSTGKKGVVSNSTVGCLTSICSIDVGSSCCDGASAGVCTT